MEIRDIASLKQRIRFLEQQQEQEKQQIKTEVSDFIESLKPGNMIRHFISSVRTSPDLRDDIMHGLVGLGTGIVTNKVLLGSMTGPFKTILATLLQAGITNAAVKYPDEIKAKGINFLTRILQSLKFKTDEDETPLSDNTVPEADATGL